jgi:hypothetical protein
MVKTGHEIPDESPLELSDILTTASAVAFGIR